jgi:tetratricopeptide (TPR) repeat protein
LTTIPAIRLQREAAAADISEMDQTAGATVEEGLNHHRAGRLAQAVAAYEQVLALQPDQPDALHYLGVIASQQGDQQKSVDLITRAISRNPTAPKYHNNLGVALRELGRLEEARKSFERAVELNPDFHDARNNLATVLDRMGRTAEAIPLWRELLAAKPDFADGWNQLGVALKDLPDPEEPVRCFREVVRLSPKSHIGLVNLSAALNTCGRHREALDSALAALRIVPDLPEGLSNQSLALCALDRNDEALQVAQRLAALHPDQACAHMAMATASKSLGHYAEVFDAYRRVLELQPDHAVAHFDLALHQLLCGRLAEGFAEYEWRIRVPQLAHFHQKPACARWRGEPLGGRRILIHAEQGAGDTLQFIRYLPMVKERGGTVLFGPQESLVRLLRHAPGAAGIFAPGEALPPFDVEAPLMSLPHIFGTNLDTIPAAVPYLPVPACAARVLPEKTRPAPRVGLVWAGNPQHKNDARRSMSVEELEPLLALEGVEFFSLQAGPRSKDRTRLRRPERLTDLSGRLTDYTVTADILQQLDLLISVDTSVVHLAGALGRPVWTLLPMVPDWRWLLEREDSPWYPTMRLFRQKKAGDWAEVIDRVKQSLKANFQELS